MAEPLSRRVTRPGALRGEVSICTDVPRAYAKLVTGEIDRSARTPFVLACSGSSSGRACLAALDDALVDLSALALVAVDERDVPVESPDSNERLVRDVLGRRVEELARFVPLRPGDGPRGAQDALAPLWPPDLVQLGLGPDGHTASLFPGSIGDDAPPGALVIWNEDPSGSNPHRRLSLTLGAIAAAHTAVFTVIGAEKTDAVARLRAGEDLPAAHVQAGRLVWLIDEAAWTEGG